LARKNHWHSKTNKFELKHVKHIPNFFRPRHCAPLARRGGGIAVGCPGAMLGAAVPKQNCFFRVTNPRTDLQNRLPKFKKEKSLQRTPKKSDYIPQYLPNNEKKDFASAFFSNLLKWGVVVLEGNQ